LARLGVKSRAWERMPAELIGTDTALLGREPQLMQLQRAFESVRTGSPALVRVVGESGMGKSFLTHHFLDDVVRRGEALVLRGRAYERESVPYKAIDGIIDALAGELVRRAEDEDLPPLPESLAALARLFPVLHRVPGVNPQVPVPGEDPLAARRRAVAALGELLPFASDGRPVIAFVDDAQWGDVDSAAVIADLLRAEALPLLVVMTQRKLSEGVSPFLEDLRARWPAAASAEEVYVGALPIEDAQRLALRLLDVTLPHAERIASAIVRESEGNPFFIGELARSNRARERADRDATAEVVTLDQLVAERLTDLPDDARSIVELVAVDGRPLPVSLIAAACGRPDVYASIALAAAGRFLRMGMREGRDVLESTHDRIRENVLRLLSPAALRERHQRLAVTLEDLGQPADAEAIATHWLGADERARAAPFAERAAEAAAGKLAFEHASRLFRVALDNPSAAPTDLRRLRRRLAEVLQLRGLNAESAREYLTAAEGAPPEEQIEDRRAAAEQLLAAGQLQAGSEILQGVLATVGLHAPRGVVSALMWLGIYRIWLGVRGLRFVERNRAELSRQEQLRLQALFTASLSFAPISLVAACMTARYLIEALRLGDREHLLYAAGLNVIFAAMSGGRVSRFETAVTELAQQGAEREGTPEAFRFHDMCLGHAMFFRMRFQKAVALFERGEARRVVTKWNGTPARLFNMYALYWTGPMNEVVARHRNLLADAAQRGDLLTIVTLRTLNHLLTCEEARVVRQNMDEALERWPKGRFLVQHCMAALYGVDIDLYEGKYAAGYERLTRALPELEREFVTQVGLLRMETHARLGRLAVASIPAHPAQRKQRLAQARKAVRRLKREYEPLGAALAFLLEATIENAVGNKAAALRALKFGIARTEEIDAFLLAVPARYRLGELLGDEEGKAMQMEAFQQMSAEGIRDPARWTQIFLPGVWTQPSLGPSSVTASG
jgi:hypothetical protein